MNNENSMLKVKELLFGDEVQNINKKFSELEKNHDSYRLKQKNENESLAEEIAKHSDSLKNSLDLNTLKLEEDMSNLESSFNELVTSFDLRVSGDVEDFKREVESRFKKVSDSIESLSQQISIDIQKRDEKYAKQVNEIKESHVSREMLAGLFSNLSSSLISGNKRRKNDVNEVPLN